MQNNHRTTCNNYRTHSARRRHHPGHFSRRLSHDVHKLATDEQPLKTNKWQVSRLCLLISAAPRSVAFYHFAQSLTGWFSTLRADTSMRVHCCNVFQWRTRWFTGGKRDHTQLEAKKAAENKKGESDSARFRQPAGREHLRAHRGRAHCTTRKCDRDATKTHV